MFQALTIELLAGVIIAGGAAMLGALASVFGWMLRLRSRIDRMEGAREAEEKIVATKEDLGDLRLNMETLTGEFKARLEQVTGALELLAKVDSTLGKSIDQVRTDNEATRKGVRRIESILLGEKAS